MTMYMLFIAPKGYKLIKEIHTIAWCSTALSKHLPILSNGKYVQSTRIKIR